jgi:RNA polymerase sigma-70 factor (ECF subfamily)
MQPHPIAATPLDAAAFPTGSSPKAATSPLLELTAGLARGDDAAWAEFHRTYGPVLFRYLLGGTQGDYDLAAEALQQTYLRVARYARLCDSPPQFERWLRRLASSALNDCRRRRKTLWERLRTVGADSGAAEREESSRPTDEKVFAALDIALGRLDHDDRTLLQEKYLEGVDVRSLATKLNLSPKAVESRLTRARTALRGHLSKLLSRHD